MINGRTITTKIHFRAGRGSRRVLHEGKEPEPPKRVTVPRISRLMALAIHMEKLVADGEVADYAELARLAHVSRARVTQIMNLLHLAPDIQEELLFLPPTDGRRAPVHERSIRPVAAEINWRKQRAMWRGRDTGAVS